MVIFSPFWLNHFVFMRPCSTFDRGVQLVGDMSVPVDTQSLEAQMEEPLGEILELRTSPCCFLNPSPNQLFSGTLQWCRMLSGNIT